MSKALIAKYRPIRRVRIDKGLISEALIREYGITEGIEHTEEETIAQFGKKEKVSKRVYDVSRLTQKQLVSTLAWFLECLFKKGGQFKLTRQGKEKIITRLLLEGGRGSGKSSLASILVVLGVYITEESALVLMKYKATLRDAVYNKMKSTISFLGLDEYFEYTDSRLEIRLMNSKAVILFKGCDDEKKIKSITSPTGYFKYVFIEEVNTFRSNFEVSSVLQSTIRGGNQIKGYSDIEYYDDGEEEEEVALEDTIKDLSSRGILAIMCWNPDQDWCHWSYDLMKETDNSLVVHSDYRGMPIDWLDKGFIIEVQGLLESARENPVALSQYNNQYLGLQEVGDNVVFKNIVVVDKFIQSDKPGKNMFKIDISRGLDFGTTDPNCYVVVNYDDERRVLQIIYELYMSNSDITKDILDVAEKKKIIEGRDYLETCYYDSAGAEFIRQIKKSERKVGGYSGDKQSHSYEPVNKANKYFSKEFGVRWLSGLTRIEISKDCENAIREFKHYRRPIGKDGRVSNKLPDGDDHTIDAVRYACYRFILAHGEKTKRSSNDYKG